MGQGCPALPEPSRSTSDQKGAQDGPCSAVGPAVPRLPGLGSQEQPGRLDSLNPETGVAKNEGKSLTSGHRGAP